MNGRTLSQNPCKRGRCHHSSGRSSSSSCSSSYSYKFLSAWLSWPSARLLLLLLSSLSLLLLPLLLFPSLSLVPADSPSRGGDVAVYVFDINQPSLPTPFCSVLVSISVLMALSTVFHCKNSPDNSPLSHSVLPVLFLLYWSFQL